MQYFIGSIGQPGEGYDNENFDRCIKYNGHFMHNDTKMKGVFDKVSVGSIFILKFNNNRIAYGEVKSKRKQDKSAFGEWNFIVFVNKWYFYDEINKKNGVNNYGVSYATIQGGGQMATIKEVTPQYGSTKVREINDNNELYNRIQNIAFNTIETNENELYKSNSIINNNIDSKIEKVELHTKTLGQIFQINQNDAIENCLEFPLSIPDYQRAYEWKTDHVRNLFNDTFDASQKKSSYLMGTLILHKTENTDENISKLEIVDGQQRLITLTILVYCMGAIDDKFHLLNSTFDNVKSIFYIQNTKKELQSLLNGKPEEQKVKYLDFLISKLQFSVLIISGNNALDKAYTFFDSLNSKGIGLSDFNLLKAHHLMFIPEEQVSLARKHNDYWQNKDSNHQRLFSTILRRIRMWSRGMDRDSKSVRNDFYEFISTVEPSELEQDEHFFNRYMQPNAFRSWYRENDKIIVNLKTPQDDSELLLPMEIPQTIEGGDSFFLYAKRYHGLYEMLFAKDENNKSTAIQFVSDLSKAIVNDYLRMAFEAATLLFYDKFGEKRLIEVATYIELIISEKRFDWGGSRPSPIRIEGVLTYIKNKNIIPIILNSTITSHVISQMNGKIAIEPRIHRDSPTMKKYWNQINNFYQRNIAKIKNPQLLETVYLIYNSELKGETTK